jgi:hypothetical protein
MMPDLRALFDFPRRLLPGKGVRMQGFGAQKAITGIQVSGANGVLTLSRSDKSGSMPVMDTETGDVTLRAGPGVRLHGYGGIHTLERLPLPPPEEPLAGPAILEWEVEGFGGYASICSLGESFNDFGNWSLERRSVYNFENGSYSYTETASGVIATYGPGETPDACDEPVIEDTFDDSFDYGDYQSDEHSEDLLAFEDLIPNALGAVVTADNLSGGAQEWVRSLWQDVSEEVTPFTQYFGWIGVAANVFGAAAEKVRFRLRNRGSAALRVDCGFYGSGISGGATDIATEINLAPGATSAWQEVPSIDPDPAKYYTAEIRRVRIGRWRTVA